MQQASPAPTLAIRLPTPFLANSLANKLGQYGSTLTLAALRILEILSSYQEKSIVRAQLVTCIAPRLQKVQETHRDFNIIVVEDERSVDTGKL